MKTSCNGSSRVRKSKPWLPGEVLLREGDPADALFVLLEGEVRGRRESGPGDVPGFLVRSGAVTGLLPFSRMTHFPLTAPGHLTLLAAAFA